MTIFQEFVTDDFQINSTSGNFTFSAPSNIALVKYWGKKDNQIPANPSVSFTLNNCKTITTLHYQQKKTKGISFEFLFDGTPKPSFEPKIQKYFERILPYCPYLESFHFIIDSKNTFPHSSGIASSASGMAALSAAIVALEKNLTLNKEESFLIKKASFLARLGSGSACRSIKGQIVVWGKTESIEESSDLFGVTFNDEVHDVFKNYQDTILLVDKGEKQVSSTVGHELMYGHPFAEQRFRQAHKNLATLKTIFKTGDINAFIEIVESEALTLHAMMMTSLPYFVLMKPATLEIIQQIWKFRKENNIPVCFTLDAGANVHVLYPELHKEMVQHFISDTLATYCQNNQYIHDHIGNGIKQEA